MNPSQTEPVPDTEMATTQATSQSDPQAVNTDFKSHM